MLVFKAHRLLYHSTLVSRVKRGRRFRIRYRVAEHLVAQLDNPQVPVFGSRTWVCGSRTQDFGFRSWLLGLELSGLQLRLSGFELGLSGLQLRLSGLEF